MDGARARRSCSCKEANCMGVRPCRSFRGKRSISEVDYRTQYDDIHIYIIYIEYIGYKYII